MKKILIASSALVAVALAGQAQAGEELTLSLGGEISSYIGIAKQSTRPITGSEDAVGGSLTNNGISDINSFQTSAKVTGSVSTTLDNGLEVGGDVTIDDGGLSGHGLYVKGGFGEVKFGPHDGAADSFKIGAPSVGPGGANGDFVSDVSYANSWVSGASRTVGYNAPAMGGFSIGVSFADEDGDGNGAVDGDRVAALGLKYETDLDGVSLAVAFVGEDKGLGQWHNLGAEVGVGNLTFAGSFGMKEDEFGEGKKAVGEDFSDAKDTGAEFGIKYAVDAAAFSAKAMYSQTEETDFSGIDFGFAYTLGAGVEWKSTLFFFDYNGEYVVEGDVETDNTGLGAVTGLVLSF